MVYVTIKCPHCQQILGRGSEPNKAIANPFRKCPYCNGTYTTKYEKEWENMSPFQRLCYYTTMPLAWGFILGLVVTCLMFAGGNTPNGALIAIVWSSSMLVVSFIVFLIRNDGVKEQINQSLKRTKINNYRQQLEKSGFVFYPLRGRK